MSLEDVNQLVELGILTPADGDRFSGGDVRRIGVVKTLEHGGLPVEGLAALDAHRATSPWTSSTARCTSGSADSAPSPSAS